MALAKKVTRKLLHHQPLGERQSKAEPPCYGDDDWNM